jgi:hypothetical protein
MSRERKRQRYDKRLQAAIERAKEQGIIKPGTVCLIDVEHDPWCNTQHGGNRCNCNPAIGKIHTDREECVRLLEEDAASRQRPN